MGQDSTIEWTDATWNPVTGCTKISPGCKHCYAETFAERFRGVKGHPYEQGFDLKLWPDRLTLPLTWRKPRRIFVNSMSDLFHADVPDAFVDQVLAAIGQAPRHTFQLLTKRAERMAAYVRRRVEGGLVPERDLPNLWLGVSVESQEWLDRARHLVGLPVAVRFLSCEPLLGPLDLGSVLVGDRPVSWVIAGGESGHRARPVDPEWVRGLRDQCQARGVPFFFKQWGGRNKKKAGRELDGRTWDEQPALSAGPSG